MNRVLCFRYSGPSKPKDISIQQVFGKVIEGTCDSCHESVFGDVGIARIVLNDEEGICVGICTDADFHPVAQIPLARLKAQKI